MCELLSEAAPAAQFLWNNQQLVHLFVPQQREPWATIHTKRPAGLDLSLTGPKGHFALGRITELGSDREFTAGARLDTLRLRFVDGEDLDKADLTTFLAEHIASVVDGKAATTAT